MKLESESTDNPGIYKQSKYVFFFMIKFTIVVQLIDSMSWLRSGHEAVRVQLRQIARKNEKIRGSIVSAVKGLESSIFLEATFAPS